jgi:ATP-binding cassette subfamily B protein
MHSSLFRKNAILNVLLFLCGHWRREWKAIIGIALATVLGTLADLFMPVYSGKIIDAIAPANGSRSQAFHHALVFVAAMALLGIMLIGTRYIAFMGVSGLTIRIMSRLASDAFWRVQRFSTDWHTSHFTGAIVRVMTRGMWAINWINDTILFAFFPSLMVLVGSSLLLGAHWLGMGLLVGLGSALYVPISIALAVGYVAPAARLSNAQDTRLGGMLADSIACNAVVKSFGAEGRESARLNRVLDKWRARTYRMWTFSTRSGTLQLTVLFALRTAVTLYALFLWWRGIATLGDVTFVLTSYFVVHSYLRDVGHQVANFQRSLNEMEEMVLLYSQPLGVEDNPQAKPLKINGGAVVFDRVTFHYGRHVTPLFSEFSLSIRPGERVGLVGHSGSGKTTLVRLLHRLYDVTGGRILVDGQDIAYATQASIREQMALVPQEPILFHRSLAENIAYARPEASMRDIEAAARLANAHEFISQQPKGYATLVGERGVKLSGGERQRVALARAFLANTPILVLDEATSNLDADAEAVIQEVTVRLLTDRTSIVIAHRLSTVRMLDRILVFDRGRVVEEGTHESLVRRLGGTYKRLFERQAKGLADTESASV